MNYGRALLVLLAALVALGAPQETAAQGVLDEAVSALRDDPVYVHPAARPTITQSEAGELRRQVAEAGGPVYIAVLPANAREED